MIHDQGVNRKAPTNAHMYTKISIHIPLAPTCFGQLCGHHQGYNVSNLCIFYRSNPDDSHIVGRTCRYELISVYMCASVGAIIVCTFVHKLCIYLFIHLFKCGLFNDAFSNSAYTA